jgi:hypothetical protein
MSSFKKSVYLPAESANNIGAYAAVVAGPLVLNGSLVDPTTGTVSFIDRGYSSGVTFTSGGNIAGATFTIVGINNGITITETIAGPNANTVSSVNIFQEIIHITVAGAIAVAYTIGSCTNTAIVLKSYDTTGITNLNKYFKATITSVTAAGNWVANAVAIYGVSGTILTPFTTANLTLAGRALNYFSLLPAGIAITQAQLQKGWIIQLSDNAQYEYPVAYPFDYLVVAILGGPNATPTFIEIAQS